MTDLPAPLVLLVAYVAGSVPFSYVAGRMVAGVDLRDVDTGTVSGTNLYKVAGFAPLAAAGVLDVLKGAVGPLLAGDRPAVAAAAVALAVAGHDWSPFLGFAGGRGISPAMGGLAVTAWPAAVLLIGGLAAGKLVGQTGLVSFLAQAAIVPVLAAVGGNVLAGALVVTVLWVKRLVGNAAPTPRTPRVYASRLLFDHDDGLRAAAGRGEDRP